MEFTFLKLTISEGLASKVLRDLFDSRVSRTSEYEPIRFEGDVSYGDHEEVTYDNENNGVDEVNEEEYRNRYHPPSEKDTDVEFYFSEDLSHRDIDTEQFTLRDLALLFMAVIKFQDLPWIAETTTKMVRNFLDSQDDSQKRAFKDGLDFSGFEQLEKELIWFFLKFRALIAGIFTLFSTQISGDTVKIFSEANVTNDVCELFSKCISNLFILTYYEFLWDNEEQNEAYVSTKIWSVLFKHLPYVNNEAYVAHEVISGFLDKYCSTNVFEVSILDRQFQYLYSLPGLIDVASVWSKLPGIRKILYKTFTSIPKEIIDTCLFDIDGTKETNLTAFEAGGLLVDVVKGEYDKLPEAVNAIRKEMKTGAVRESITQNESEIVDKFVSLLSDIVKTRSIESVKTLVMYVNETFLSNSLPDWILSEIVTGIHDYIKVVHDIVDEEIDQFSG